MDTHKVWTIKRRPKTKTSLKNTQLCVNILRLRSGSNPFAASIIGGREGNSRGPRASIEKGKKGKKGKQMAKKAKKGKKKANKASIIGGRGELPLGSQYSQY